MTIKTIQNLADVESIQNLSQLNAMSGETSSPADGGHVRRGLPPSAALRWNHYHFVSPVHYSKDITSQASLMLLALYIWGIHISTAHAEFSYQGAPIQYTNGAAQVIYNVERSDDDGDGEYTYVVSWTYVLLAQNMREVDRTSTRAEFGDQTDQTVPTSLGSSLDADDAGALTIGTPRQDGDGRTFTKKSKRLHYGMPIK